jgi:secondary thiamine-phosphate synthase enzyme
MIQQIEIFEMSRQTGLRRKPSGFKIYAPLAYAASPINGDAQICKHTSCGLSINENADPDVRVDMESIFNRLVPENRPEYEHTLEGADDMPAHAKSTLSGVSLTIPITDGRLNMGIWQGIYFCEYRNYGGARRLVVTIMGE